MAANERAWSAWFGAYLNVVVGAVVEALPPLVERITPSEFCSQLTVS
jgi:hypothetical protein